MTFVDLEAALASPGLRLVVAAGVPSPWSQAALAVFRFKRLPFVACRTRALDAAFARWNGARNLPAVLMNDEPVRTGWAEILALAERLAPETPLVPDDGRERALVMGLCHELMTEGGVLWCARLLTIHAGLSTDGREGFPLRIAQYLAPRYGFGGEDVTAVRARAMAGLSLLDDELAKRGGPYFGGETVTALDLHCAAAMNALVPLPERECPLAEPFRAAFTWMGRTLGDAITPRLLAHRAQVVARHFPNPIEL
jgi:glutathione S-transferase